MSLKQNFRGVIATAALAGLAFAGVATADNTKPELDPRQQDKRLTPQAPTPVEADKPVRTSEPLLPAPTGKPAAPVEPTRTTADKALVDGYLRTWPARSADVARVTIAAYGQPSEATPSHIIWYGNGPWKKTVVYRDEAAHEFPKPHGDVIEQFVELKVPVAKIDDVIAFDGSLTVYRTEGLVSSNSESEAMNYLALNLAAEIAKGKKSTAQARAQLTRAVGSFAAGQKVEAATALAFVTTDQKSADPDKASLK